MQPQTNNTPTTTRPVCGQNTLVFVWLTWLQPHKLDTTQTKSVDLGLISPKDVVLVTSECPYSLLVLR